MKTPDWSKTNENKKTEWQENYNIMAVGPNNTHEFILS